MTQHGLSFIDGACPRAPTFSGTSGTHMNNHKSPTRQTDISSRHSLHTKHEWNEKSLNNFRSKLIWRGQWQRLKLENFHGRLLRQFPPLSWWWKFPMIDTWQAGSEPQWIYISQPVSWNRKLGRARTCCKFRVKDTPPSPAASLAWIFYVFTQCTW